MAYGIPHTIWMQAPSFLSVSWRSCNCMFRPRIIPPRRETQRGRDTVVTADRIAGEALTSAAVVRASDSAVHRVNHCVPICFDVTRRASASAWRRGVEAAGHRSGGRSAQRRAAFSRAVPAPSTSLDDASFSSLAEKSVSPGRSLDKRCCVHHTVVYLIRYAMLW
jgi:hypothetical protein